MAEFELLQEYRRILREGHNAHEKRAAFARVFFRTRWEIFQQGFNTAERTPLSLGPDIGIRMPTPAQKFWADTAHPAVGHRGAVIIAPTGTGKSDLIALLGENNKYNHRTRVGPTTIGVDAVAQVIPAQIFFITRKTLKPDLLKAWPVMQTRSDAELITRAKAFVAPEEQTVIDTQIARGQLPLNLDPNVCLLSYKQFSNLLQARNSDGRRWWAGFPLRGMSDSGPSVQPTEFVRQPEFAPGKAFASPLAYNELNKRWTNVVRMQTQSLEVDGNHLLLHLTYRSTQADFDSSVFRGTGTMHLNQYLHQIVFRVGLRNDDILQAVFQRVDNNNKIASFRIRAIARTPENVVEIKDALANRILEDFVMSNTEAAVTNTTTLETLEISLKVKSSRASNWASKTNGLALEQLRDIVQRFNLGDRMAAKVTTASEPTRIPEQPSFTMFKFLVQFQPLEANINPAQLQNELEPFFDLSTRFWLKGAVSQLADTSDIVPDVWYVTAVYKPANLTQFKAAVSNLIVQTLAPAIANANATMAPPFYDDELLVGSTVVWFELKPTKDAVHDALKSLNDWMVTMLREQEGVLLPVKPRRRGQQSVESDFDEKISQEQNARDAFGWRLVQQKAQESTYENYAFERLPPDEKESFHPADGCTFIFDEADLLTDKTQLAQGEGADPSLILQALSDADCAVYFLSATIPFFVGLAFLQALQPSIYLSKRIGNTAHYLPAKPLEFRDSMLVNYRRLSSTHIAKLFEAYFEPGVVREGLDDPTALFKPSATHGLDIESRACGLIGYAPSVEEQRDSFAEVDYKEYINVLLSEAHQLRIEELIEKPSVAQRPQKLLSALNYFDPDNARFVPDDLRITRHPVSLAQHVDALMERVPGLRQLIELLRQIDNERLQLVNDKIELLGRIVIVSHCQDDTYGIELVASGLQAVGYRWARVVVRVLTTDEQAEADAWSEAHPNQPLPVEHRSVAVLVPHELPSREAPFIHPMRMIANKINFVTFSDQVVLKETQDLAQQGLAVFSRAIIKTAFKTSFTGMSITEARERKLIVRESEHYAQQQKFFRDAHDKVIYFWPGRALVPKRPNGKVAGNIYEKFRHEAAWFFFRRKLEEGEMTFVRFDFPWITSGDKFSRIVGHFSNTKLAKSIRNEFMQTYRELLNAPDTQINSIGLVLIGNGYLSGIDVFGTSAIVKFDAPPTQQVAIQGSGRANRKGGFAKFPYDAWKLPEYVILRGWMRPPEAAQYSLINGLRQERVRNLDSDDEPEFESSLIEDFRDRIDRTSNPQVLRELRRQLNTATRRGVAEERIEERLRQYERHVLEDFSSRPMPFDALTTPLADADILSPAQIVRHFSLGNIRTEVYNIVGQLFFRRWSVDYEIIKPKIPAEQCVTLSPTADCLPTGFCLSWVSCKKYVTASLPQPADEARIRELEYLIPRARAILLDTELHRPMDVERQENELHAMEQELQALQMGNVRFDQWTALVNVVLGKPHVYGNVFSEIVRGRTGRLFVVVKHLQKKVHELLPEYFGNVVTDPTKFLSGLVNAGLAVWQIRMTLEFTLETQEEGDAAEVMPTRKPGRKEKPPKRIRPDVITLDYRLEPFNVHRNWAKQAPLETSLADVDRTAFNAFFDLRTMDREMIGIQSAQSQKAWELGVKLDLFAPGLLRQSQTAGGLEDPAVHVRDIFDLARLAPTAENQRSLRTALGHMFIDGMADWNQAVIFLSQAFGELLERNYAIDYALCATLCGVLYRNAYGDFAQIHAFVQRYFLPTTDDIPSLIILLNFTAQFGFEPSGSGEDESLGVVFNFLEQYMHVNMRAALVAPRRNDLVLWKKSPLYMLTEWIKGKLGSRMLFDEMNRLEVARKLDPNRFPSEFKSAVEYGNFLKAVLDKKVKLTDLDGAEWKKRHADYVLQHNRRNYNQLLRIFDLDQDASVRDLAATVPNFKMLAHTEKVARAIIRTLRLDVTPQLADALDAIFTSSIGFNQNLTSFRLTELLEEFKGRRVLPFYDPENNVFTIGADLFVARHSAFMEDLGSLAHAMKTPRFGIIKSPNENQWYQQSKALLQTEIRAFLGVSPEWLEDAQLGFLYQGRMLAGAKLLWQDSVSQFPPNYVPTPTTRQYLAQLLKIENQIAYNKLKNVCSWSFGRGLRWLPFLVQTGAFWSAYRTVGLAQAAIQTIIANPGIPAVRAFLGKAGMLGESLKHMFIPSVVRVAKTYRPAEGRTDVEIFTMFWQAVTKELAKVLADAFIEVDRTYVL